MTRDLRRTGGAANYEWQSGTRVEPVTDTAALKAQVLRYLADCRRFRHILRADDHPTEDGVLKIVYTRTDEEKQTVRDVYRQATRTRPKPPASGQGGAP